MAADNFNELRCGIERAILQEATTRIMENGQVADRILGIDPGLNITGYGVLDFSSDGPRLVEAGVVRSTPRASLVFRVREIHEGVAEVIASLSPSSVALEELYSHYQRPKTAILMGHARGVICLAAAQSDLPVKHYAATKVKKILTGSGRAPKAQMQPTASFGRPAQVSVIDRSA